MRLLVDHRDDLVAERTRLQSRIRWHLHEIAPELEIPARGLKLQHVVERVAARLADRRADRRDRRELLDRVRELNRRINELERQITPLIRELAPTLLEHPRLRRADRRQARRRDRRRPTLPLQERLRALERHRTPTRQLGNTTRFRLNRGGNRQVNAALHRIALTQARAWPQGRDYIAKRLRQGNTKTEALRLLRRRLSDVVYRTLLIDEHAAQPDPRHPHPHDLT